LVDFYFTMTIKVIISAMSEMLPMRCYLNRKPCIETVQDFLKVLHEHESPFLTLQSKLVDSCFFSNDDSVGLKRVLQASSLWILFIGGNTTNELDESTNSVHGGFKSVHLYRLVPYLQT
jgi:hypothetical protein